MFTERPFLLFIGFSLLAVFVGPAAAVEPVQSEQYYGGMLFTFPAEPAHSSAATEYTKLPDAEVPEEQLSYKEQTLRKFMSRGTYSRVRSIGFGYSSSGSYSYPVTRARARPSRSSGSSFVRVRSGGGYGKTRIRSRGSIGRANIRSRGSIGSVGIRGSTGIRGRTGIR